MPDTAKIRLGQLLIQRGLLARAQLVKALSSQMVYGGRLGTNLIENEFVAIKDVSETLAAQHGVISADSELLAAIEAGALSLIPRELAEQFGAVPIGAHGDEVLAAMMDPTTARVAELSHQLQRPIRPFVTPELRLFYLLEKHYGIPRASRFLRLPESRAVPTGRRRYLIPTLGGRRPAELHLNGAEVTPIVTNASAAGQIEQIVVTPGGSGNHPAVGTNVRPVHHVLRALATVGGGGELARLLVRPLSPQSAVSVLFWIKGKMAVGCCAHGVGAPLTKLQQIVLPLDGPSLMRWSWERRSLVRARGDFDGMQANIARFLDTPRPTDVCVAPVILSDRVVNLIVVHAHSGQFDKETLADYTELAGAATTAYTRLKQQLVPS